MIAGRPDLVPSPVYRTVEQPRSATRKPLIRSGQFALHHLQVVQRRMPSESACSGVIGARFEKSCSGRADRFKSLYGVWG